MAGGDTRPVRQSLFREIERRDPRAANALAGVIAANTYARAQKLGLIVSNGHVTDSGRRALAQTREAGDGNR